MTDSNKRSE